MNQAREAVLSIIKQMESAVMGQHTVVESLVVCLLCNGNLLLEGFPGTAKTRAIKSLANILDTNFGRLQFTPDLLPSDVTGTEIYHHEEGSEKLRFQEGPIFNNVVLVDEINRAPAKVQAALLEAMEERQVTVAGKTYKLPELFIVLATQNPIEQEGTYPLPEAQLDRFLMKVKVGYPKEATEQEIIKIARKEEETQWVPSQLVTPELIFETRHAIHKIHVSDAIEKYIVSLIMATREPERCQGNLKSWIGVGASPRASIALEKCSRAFAWLKNKDFVDPDDVRSALHSVLRHRLILSYDAVADGVDSDGVIDEILKQVAVI